MRKFSIGYNLVTALTLGAALGAPAAHAGLLKNVVGGCKSLLWPGKAYYGTDADLIDKWVLLRDRTPQLAQVKAISPNHLVVNWMNFDTMTIEELSVPRPDQILVADDTEYVRYHRDLDRGVAAAEAEARALVGKVVRLGQGLGEAKITNATLRHLDVEYIDSATYARHAVTIARPRDLDVVPNQDFDELAVRAHLLATHPGLRPGQYVFWAADVSVRSSVANTAADKIVFNFESPLTVAYSRELLESLVHHQKVHARVSAVDLVGGVVTLTSPAWTIHLPLRPDVFAHSEFVPSPLGVLDEVPHQGYVSFRKFREAFLFGDLRPNAAVIQYRDVGSSPLRAPEEFSHTWKFWRLASFDAESVTLQMGPERVTLRGANALAQLSFGFDFEKQSADYLVMMYELNQQFSESFEGARSRTYGRARPRANVATSKFNGDLELIVKDLATVGLERAQVMHYLGQTVTPANGAKFFWTTQRTAKAEWSFISRRLHASRITSLSAVTQDFAGEVYSRATSAARELRGFSEGR